MLLLSINAVYFPYIAFFSLLFLVFVVPWFLLIFAGTGRGRLDDAVRVQNVLFGRFLLLLSRPLVRVDLSGAEHFPRETPCILALNHRCFADIILSTRLPIRNANVVIRSWPFRIPVFGSFMRGAGYFDIESRPFDELVETVREQAARGVSLVVFPEGHRSRDGRLQAFRSGAFLVAELCDLPIVPVCLTGSERMIPYGHFLLRPARIEVRIFEPIHPSRFPEEKRALKMRREAERVVRRYLGEENGANGDGREESALGETAEAPLSEEF
ncbi:1-acyl-sn-glycerol-3-phosphate acyltransferase [Candidatus Sumerlaeota bacterium]|nr:1-acyl-sn-glycerol-3-phosphate acyltransferase [Candidatus Sumerlaeota bacterium]